MARSSTRRLHGLSLAIAVDGWDLPAPLANRMCHLDFDLDIDAWFSGMMTGFRAPAAPAPKRAGTDPVRKAKVTGSITRFLRSHRGMVLAVPEDPSQAGRGWPSPRCWDNVSQIPHEQDQEREH